MTTLQSNTIYLYTLMLIGLLALSPSEGHAQGQADSLLRRIADRQGYYTPTAITDPALLAQRATQLGQASALVTYLRTDSMPRGSRSILMGKLSLPLVTDYSPGHSLDYLPSLTEGLQAQRTLSPEEVSRRLTIGTMAHLQHYALGSFAHGYEALMSGRQELRQVTSKATIESLIPTALDRDRVQDFANARQPGEIERRYWIPSLESSVQFSQNYISDNWYKGGASNLNLYMRTYLALEYIRDQVRWKTELEDKLSLYSTDASVSGQRYRIGEDLLRLRSNFGLKANKKWSYTIDAELRTQLFSTYNDDRTITQAAFLSPMTTNIGLGMQYNHSYKSSKVYGRKVSLSMNIAPLSHTWRMSIRKDIDLKRHGLTPEVAYYHKVGSTLRGQLQWDFNMDISWTSRVYLNSNFASVEAEWENTLNMRISRYLSTRINIHLRFDDSVVPKRSEGWSKYIQVNELLSFGFNYKL